MQPPPPQKLCPSCGASVPAEANVCSTCGYNFNTGPYASPPAMGAPPAASNSNWSGNYPRDGYPSQSGSADGFGIAGLVLGILSIPLFCVWCLSAPCAVLALIFGGLGLKGRHRALAIAGMICAGISILLTVGIIILFAFADWGTRGSSPFPIR